MWINEFTNELGRMDQVVGTLMPKENNTIFFIPRGKVPNRKMDTYGHIVAEIRPHKMESHCIRMTVGGDRLKFDGVKAT